jgi:hypothetical protein
LDPVRYNTAPLYFFLFGLILLSLLVSCCCSCSKQNKESEKNEKEESLKLHRSNQKDEPLIEEKKCKKAKHRKLTLLWYLPFLVTMVVLNAKFEFTTDDEGIEVARKIG